MIPRSEDTIPGGYIETCGCWRDQAALLRDQSERAISFTPAPSHHHRYHNWGQCLCHCHHHWVAEINIFTSAFLLSSSLASKSLMVPQLHSMPRKRIFSCVSEDPVCTVLCALVIRVFCQYVTNQDIAKLFRRPFTDQNKTEDEKSLSFQPRSVFTAQEPHPCLPRQNRI